MLQVYGFSSAKKMASVLVDLGNGTLRLYIKGASEWVLKISKEIVESDGTRVPMNEQKHLDMLAVVTAMASRGLRTLVRPSSPLLHACHVCGPLLPTSFSALGGA
jgi:magnesium-transporting ATPase (P-type)